MGEYDLSKIYIQYCEGVLSGDILACKWIRLACERFKSWFDKDDRYFDYDDVDRRIRFVAKMKHTGDDFAGKPFILLPWQQFCFAGIFGWKYVETGYRVCQNVLLEITRKNGKTALAAAIALAQCALDKVQGQEVDIVANSRLQAKICYGAAQHFAESLDPLGALYKVRARDILTPYNKSKIQVLASDANTNDGFNASTAIIDEFHAAKDWRLYGVLQSSQGTRAQPLTIIITTAGYLLDGYPLFEHRQMYMNILDGSLDDDSCFGLLYELDEGDDYKDENVWTKCIPSLDVTVRRDNIRKALLMATNSPSTLTETLTKHFNMYVTSNNAWLDREDIVKVMQPVDLEEYGGMHCVVGLDLASVSDLSVVSAMIPIQTDDANHPKYIFKNYIFLPEDTIDKSVNKAIYNRWRKSGELIVTKGNVCDYNALQDCINDINKICPIDAIYYDQWNSTQIISNCTNIGYNCRAFSQGLGNFNRVTKEFERRLLMINDFIIDKNEVCMWNLCNCTIVVDSHDNAKPDKGPNRNNKIDSVIAMLMAMGGWMIENNIEPELLAVC